MPIPQRLLLEPVSDDIIREMSDLCDKIEDAVERGVDFSALLGEWQSNAANRCDPTEFATYWKFSDKETFVRAALAPVPQLDSDLKYQEVIAVLCCVMESELSEADTRFYLQWLEAQFSGSNISDLIYWPDEWFGDASLFRESDGSFKPDAELSPDQILAYAMAKSSRSLDDAPDSVDLPYPMP